MREMAFWAWDTNSRTIVGPKRTEEEINQLAFRTIDADFKVYFLPTGFGTTSKRIAVSMVKGRLLEESNRLQDSMRHFHHIKEA